MKTISIIQFFLILTISCHGQGTQLNYIKGKIDSYLKKYDVYEGGFDDTKHGYQGELEITDVVENGNAYIVSGTYADLRYILLFPDTKVTARFKAKVKVILDDVEVVCMLKRTFDVAEREWKCYYVNQNCDIGCPE